MVNMRRTHEAAFKAKVALEAVKGRRRSLRSPRTSASIPTRFPSGDLIFLEMLPELFSQRHLPQGKARDELEAELYRQIGQLKLKLQWLKKNRSCSRREKEGVC